jgi:hypothetical protein
MPSSKSQNVVSLKGRVDKSRKVNWENAPGSEIVHIIKALKQVKKEDLKYILNSINSRDIEELCKCLHNICHENIGLSNSTKAKLRKKFLPHKKQIQFLTRKSDNVSVNLRKRKLMAGGGFFISLLSAAIPALISLFSNLVKKK